jgi:hypothetical protein
MTSCLNHDYVILFFMHFPYLLNENPSFIIVSAETEYFSTTSWYRNINSCTPIFSLATYIKKIKHISHFSDRPVPIFSDVRFTYLALVQDTKITCVLPANACCTVYVNCPPEFSMLFLFKIYCI